MAADVGANFHDDLEPTIITWSIVPDGTPVPSHQDRDVMQPSELRAVAETTFGGFDVGRQTIEQAVQAWDAHSAIQFEYVEYDDGAPQYESPGIPGIRADLRFAGVPIDGVDTILALGAFPPAGDISIDISQFV